MRLVLVCLLLGLGCSKRILVQDTGKEVRWAQQTSVDFDFKEMEPFSCSELLVPAPGALVGDSVVASHPKYVSESWRFMSYIPSPGIIKYTLCNVGPQTIDLPSYSWRFVVFRPKENSAEVASVLQ